MVLFDFKFLSSIYNVALKKVVAKIALKLINLREGKAKNRNINSFGIYLIHCFCLNILNKGLRIYPSAFPPVVGEVVILAYALIASILGCLILYRLPVLERL